MMILRSSLDPSCRAERCRRTLAHRNHPHVRTQRLASSGSRSGWFVRQAWFVTIASTMLGGCACDAGGEEISVAVVANHPAATDPRMGSSIASLNRPEDDASRRLSAYHADASGQWSVPPSVSQYLPERSGVDGHLDESHRRYVPLVLNTPAGTIGLQVSVSINGQSPEQLEHEFIQSVLNSEASGSTEKALGSEDLRGSDSSVIARRYARDSIATKLKRLVATTNADADELAWMLEQWRPGPLWLITRDAMSPPARMVEPLVRWLDLNDDGLIDSDEWSNDSKRWQRVDTNRDRVIERTELTSAIERRGSSSGELSPRWDWNLAWGSATPIDRSSADSPRADSPARSPARDAMIAHLAISFEITDAASKLTVESEDFVLQGAGPYRVIAEHTGTRTALRCWAHVDAQLTEVNSAQISIAARLTPTPIWNWLDRDSDGRLTELERRWAGRRFSEIDRNGDQSISADEWPVEIECLICQGTAADAILRSESGLVSPAPSSIPTPVPEWFSGMDVNQDDTLSRDEFLGPTETFDQYDLNRDRLITAAEVASVTESP